jgi:KaiC/GvpD/RAD55 family RecA-like ATPase
VKQTGQTFTVVKDDHDWLLELGRKQGTSRILPASSMHHLVDKFRPDALAGLGLPWASVDGVVRFMPGKVSVWSGPTYSGKTAFLRQLMLHAITQKHRVLFISLEEEPEDVWREFVCMAAGTRAPNKHQVQWAEDVFEDRLYVFDSMEAIEPTILMGIIRYAVEKFGFTHIVIDSLMRLNMRMDDYDGQREMGNMLGRVARAAKTHIHLVAHPRKTANSRAPMDLYDIRGAQDIVAQADLVLTLERKHEELHTNLLTVWKQRGDANWIGEIALWYDVHSRQLKCNQFADAVRYLPPDAYGSVIPFREQA